MMEVTFLGTGTSCGQPVLGCDCDVCRSTDPRDKRLRCSIMIETERTRLLVDCGPDFRQQMLKQPFRKIDGILLTHIHYDHVGGIDDLRPYCSFGDIDLYADEHVVKTMHHTLPYCFKENKYPGVPRLVFHTIKPHNQLRLGDIDVMPIEVMHGAMPILGYRFGKFAYITDIKTISDKEIPYLRGVKILVVNALRFEKEHHSHQLVSDAMDFAKRVGAERTLFIHSCHHIGCHEEVQKSLSKGFEMAYDGQKIIVNS